MGAVMTSNSAPQPETIRTTKSRIACDGTGDGLANAALGHPRVWLEIDPDQGYADCGYCDRRFILAGGVADQA
ncbi:zinc-finger domain-containing protein [Sphingopyxis sp. FBM22]|nr:zinc-finger domain-containing protein [Sphingopyxis yananensis]MCC2601568.1 zinc-finger domain-containing protein [Sphingopyxis yananensis]